MMSCYELGDAGDPAHTTSIRSIHAENDLYLDARSSAAGVCATQPAANSPLSHPRQ